MAVPLTYRYCSLSNTKRLCFNMKSTSSRVKIEEHKVSYFQGHVQTGEAHGFKTFARRFCTEIIALTSSNNELLQIVNILSNTNPPEIFPSILTSADLPSILIRLFTNKVEKRRYDIDSEHATSTIATVTTTATFASFEKVSQSARKECILNYSH